jgi:hypothetical protein
MLSPWYSLSEQPVYRCSLAVDDSLGLLEELLGLVAGLSLFVELIAEALDLLFSSGRGRHGLAHT